jgi:hypothetical protein
MAGCSGVIFSNRFVGSNKLFAQPRLISNSSMPGKS